MREPFDVTTLIFAVLAIFVAWKLRSVLGSRTGSEKPPFNPFERRKTNGDATPGYQTSDDGKVIRLPGATAPEGAAPARPVVDPEQWKGLAEPASPAVAGLNAIAAADPTFTGPSFAAGARAAYEMIVTAFAAGDLKTLRPLLAKEVLDSFSDAIAQRQQRGERVETAFVGIDRATVEQASLRAGTAQVTVRFLSKLISATHDKSGAVIDGEPGKVVDMTDVWTFARDVTSRDPNWKLVATEAGQ